MYLTVKYRTIENSTHTRLRRERRSGVQLNKSPLNNNIKKWGSAVFFIYIFLSILIEIFLVVIKFG